MQKKFASSLIAIAIAAITFSSSSSWAWGRRGHEAVASLAGRMVAQDNPSANFLSDHSYDLGYYANIPDFVWKKPETYKKEHFQHYIDFEFFEKAFKEKNGGKDDWNPNRTKFFAKYSNINTKAGRAPWRIQELTDKLAEITKQLKTNKKLTSDERRKLQGDWLLTAGVIGHYVGDLGMPLHVSEDYDGRKSGQDGLHSWFEDAMVDELYPTIQQEVYNRAKSRWKDFQKANAKKSAFDLAIELGKDSQKVIPEMLKIDKTVGRANNAKASEAFKEMITERLAASVLRLALIWSNNSNFSFDNQRFYIWQGEPAYIEAVAEKIDDDKK